jgi:hypothetical protein
MVRKLGCMRGIASSGLLGVSIVLFLITGAMLGRGIDLTDEGAYLNAIARPDLYPYSLSQFGLLLHSLLIVSNYNVVLLRALNYVALLGCTAILVARVVALTDLSETLTKFERVAIGAAFTISALLFYCIWLPTPNYNSLNLIGGLIVAVAAVGAPGVKQPSIPVASMVLAGIGLALCALSKPTTGAVLGLLLWLSPWNSLRQKLWFVLGAGAISALLCSALLLTWRGSPTAIMDNYRTGVLLADGLLAGRSAFDIYFWRPLPFPPEFRYIAIVSGIVVVMYVTSMRANAEARPRPMLQALALAGIFGACVWVQFRTDWWNRPANWTSIVSALVLAACCAIDRRPRIDKHLAKLVILFLLLPFAIGFGSNTGLLRASSQAATIWAVGSILVVAALAQGAFLKTAVMPLAVINVTATAVVLVWAEYFPQRQVAPLWEQNTWMSAHGREHALRVDAASAAYFAELTTAANGAGFTTGTPVIDLTGTGAVSAYVMGGDAIGSPYFSGGWPGSQWMVEETLRGISREQLSRAWILTSPRDGNAVSPAALRVHGLNFPDDYVEVTRATAAAFAVEHILWRPRHPVE